MKHRIFKQKVDSINDIIHIERTIEKFQPKTKEQLNDLLLGFDGNFRIDEVYFHGYRQGVKVFLWNDRIKRVKLPSQRSYVFSIFN